MERVSKAGRPLGKVSPGLLPDYWIYESEVVGLMPLVLRDSPFSINHPGKSPTFPRKLQKRLPEYQERSQHQWFYSSDPEPVLLTRSRLNQNQGDACHLYSERPSDNDVC